MFSPVTSVLILQAGTPPDDVSSVVGDISTWFSDALGMSLASLEIIPVYQGEPLPAPDTSRVAIITGSWSMVTDRHPWSETLAQWIRDAMAIEMPLLGVCYGHQLMAHALGGTVDYHPGGCEIGLQEIHLTAASRSDPLLQDWPVRFSAHLTHLQTITQLPPGAQVLGFSEHDPHQIVRYGVNAISTQFHPEFSQEIAAACIRRRAASLESEGKDPAALLAVLGETPEAKRLLLRFIERSDPLNLIEFQQEKTHVIA